MRQTAKPRKQKTPRQAGRQKMRPDDCNNEPLGGWDQFEVLVLWIAASRAMEQLRKRSAAAAEAGSALAKTADRRRDGARSQFRPSHARPRYVESAIQSRGLKGC